MLLGQVDGTTTAYKQKPIVLHTADARIETIECRGRCELLNILINPNLLYLLFLGGIIGIAYEVFHPGVILPGTLGAVSLILALFGFSIVSINLAGVVLMIFGVALLGLEAWVRPRPDGHLRGDRDRGRRAHAVPHARRGREPDPRDRHERRRRDAARGRRHQGRRGPPPAGDAGGGVLALVGRTAVVRTRLQPEGQVYLHGELWQAEPDGDDVAAGREVVVEAVDGLTLRVTPAPAPTTEGVTT